jgi:malonyl-CoA/methylmalonyl-CoA synthetase
MYNSNYLAKHIKDASIGNEDKVFAWLDDNSSVSYGELFNNAEKIAIVLQKNGVTPGDRVAAQVGKSITVVELYLGTVLAGGVFLPLNTAYTAAEIAYFLEDASPAVFVCDPTIISTLKGVAEKANVGKLLGLSSDGLSGSLINERAETWGDYTEVERQADDLAAILYTSGTTGRSKGAMLSHRALASNAATLKQYWQFTSEDCLIHALPIFHIHGLFVAINITLFAGSSLHFLTQFDADKIISRMNRSSVLMGVPTFYVRLLKSSLLNKDLTSNMRLFVSGSAPLLSDTHIAWQQKTGHAILERYGMTETNMNTSNPYDGERRPGTVGFPLPDVELKITHPDSGETLGQGEVGQIEVRGPNVFSGYWKIPEKTAQELRPDGWFLTGDVGVIDNDGYLSIVGRSKDLIISGGFNVYPKEIEAIIDDNPMVIESAVIGVPHADFGEAVVAVVVKQLACEATEASIKTPMSEQLAKYKQPKRVFFVDELPRNAMGKVQKAKLREDYQNCFIS